MTISTTTTRISYQANGSNTNWSFSFPAGPDPDIFVLVKGPDGTVTQITTNLKINLNPPIDPNPTSVGGSVVYPVTGAPLAIGNQITIARIVPTIQPTSISNQSTIYPPVIEQALDYLTMEIQQLQDQFDRQFTLPITEQGPLVLPPCPQRANKFLAFDENCQPVAVGNSNPVTSSNAIRVPNTESIPELPGKTARPGTILTFNNNGDPILAALPPPNLQPLLGQRASFTGTHTVVNTEKGFLLQLGGNIFYDLILGDPTTYDADFSIAVFNTDIYTGPGTGRAKRIMFNGTIMPGGLLWPGQWVYIFRLGNTWVSNPRDQRWKPGTPVTFYADVGLGQDDGTTDGLATGTGATKTYGAAVATAQGRLDCGGILVSNPVLVQLAPGIYPEHVTINQAMVGSQPITIKGADDGVNSLPWIIRVPTGVGIAVDNGNAVIVKGITFDSTANGCEALRASHVSSITANNCRFGNFPQGFIIHAFDGSSLDLRDIEIVGNCTYSVAVHRESTARVSGLFIFGNSLTFDVACFVAHVTSSIIGGVFAGAGDSTDFHLTGGAGCVGLKYWLIGNSILSLGTGVADTLPGNQPGAVSVGPMVHGTDSCMVLS